MTTDSGLRWTCHTCQTELRDGPAILDHHNRTGHTGASPHFTHRATEALTDPPPPAFRRAHP
jgi:hypothetical protein